MSGPDSLPLLTHAWEDPTAFAPEGLVAAVRAERGLPEEPVPGICILEFDGELTDSLVADGTARPCPTWACFHTAMFTLDVDGVECGIVPRTIGGPYAVLVAEQLRVCGARVVFGLASAGRVDPALPLPCLVIADRAIRDEGTSFHYLPPAGTIEAPRPVVEALTAELAAFPLHVSSGVVWTTDAPYRETHAELARHAEAGALAVEMQAASLFAFAAARGVPVGLVAHVTNAVDYEGEPFHKGPDDIGRRLLEAICRAGIRFLQKAPDEGAAAEA
jgi:uridine phosphorylase